MTTLCNILYDILAYQFVDLNCARENAARDDCYTWKDMTKEYSTGDINTTLSSQINVNITSRGVINSGQHGDRWIIFQWIRVRGLAAVEDYAAEMNADDALVSYYSFNHDKNWYGGYT
ncbi:hypothetical protein N7457_003676 [Penicillium paradoxum]|uniref:uncharacterized protein n=1 Tax=Penicillium paradoxum TaxID=176176 RepID=UPI002546D781|nr:uncharacterized protein N7457_003676 [Penicillium paradoxum]KAJ5788686.1 hypothetical protein N7457_003676 [Penicillium paradoxum]